MGPGFEAMHYMYGGDSGQRVVGCVVYTFTPEQFPTTIPGYFSSLDAGTEWLNNLNSFRRPCERLIKRIAVALSRLMGTLHFANRCS
jgi:hypothetical protein